MANVIILYLSKGFVVSLAFGACSTIWWSAAIVEFCLICCAHLISENFLYNSTTINQVTEASKTVEGVMAVVVHGADWWRCRV